MVWTRLSDRAPEPGQRVLILTSDAPDANPARVTWADFLYDAEQWAGLAVYWSPFASPFVDPPATTPEMPEVAVRRELLAESSEEDFSGARFHGQVRINGVEHHLTLVRVADDESGAQRAADAYGRDDLDALQGVYEGRYQTVRVPGLDGDFVAFVVPHAD